MLLACLVAYEPEHYVLSVIHPNGSVDYSLTEAYELQLATLWRGVCCTGVPAIIITRMTHIRDKYIHINHKTKYFYGNCLVNAVLISLLYHDVGKKWAICGYVTLSVQHFSIVMRD